MAYISKFTGAQIDDLLDKSKTMGAAVDELAQDVAGKEDATNKVTSITASADDTHYPSAKAVKTALTNLADGEDLTSVDNALKLADKAYAPTAFSGMGRKYLRKNLVSGKNILTQAMLPSANTIYIIQYDYDLNGATITIPENCTLDFQGGSLTNGTVNCNKTLFVVTSGSVLTPLAGTVVNDKMPITWFGAEPSTADTLIDITNKLDTALTCSSATGVAIIIPAGKFYHSGVIMPKGSTLQGQDMNTSILALMPNSTSNAIAIVNNDCEVSNITIQGNGRNQSYNNVYQDNEGNGICIADGSRFGLNDNECLNTKIYNIIIQECGNNGLAIIDDIKWVFSFNNVTIKTCGNIGFLDRSSDNNYYGFNISHCENLGMYAEGSRNRYTTFKVFVCGINHKKAEVSAGEAGQIVTRPDGMYWQGVRVKGRHMSFVGFDIQECGAELLYVENNASNNYIQASLDRPGFGVVNGVSTVLEYSPYNIYGSQNICYLFVFAGDSGNYPTVKPQFSWQNYIIESKESFIEGYLMKKYGYAADINAGYDTTYVPVSLRSNEGTSITNANFADYLTIVDNAATLNQTVDIVRLNKAKVLNTGVSFRFYPTIDKREQFFYIFNPYDSIRFNVWLTQTSIQLGIYYKNSEGTYNEIWNSLKANAADIDYLDVYLYANKYMPYMEAKTPDGNIAYCRADEQLGYTGYFTKFRFFSPQKISHVHMTDGYVNPCTDIESTYGTHFSLTKDVSASASTIYALDSPPTQALPAGFQYFSTTLNKPIWWNGSAWVDSTGAVV